MRFRTEPAHRLHQDQDPVSPSERQEHHTKCSMRLPPTGAAAKLLTMLSWVRSGPNRHPKAAPRVQKQKSRDFCNFFAIADCCELPSCGLRRKSAGNRLHDGLFSLCGDGRESVIAKKLQKRLNFCFRDGRIASTGRYRNGVERVRLRSSGFISFLFRKYPDSVTMRN